MGSWGTAIFSDDTAADVRAEWREGILDGVPPEELTARLIDSYGALMQSPDDGVVFWLALAAAQHETGRLCSDVRAKALGILERGGDVARWEEEDESLAKRRKVVLGRLGLKLAGPQPAPKRLKRPVPHGVDFKVGDAILLRSPGGKRAIAVVVAHSPGSPKGTLDPVVELLLWDDKGVLPSREFMATAPPLHTHHDVPESVREGPPRIRPNLFAVHTAQKSRAFSRDIGEVVATNIPRHPAGDYRDGSQRTGETILSGVQWRWFGVFMDQPSYEATLEMTRTHTRPHKNRWKNFFTKDTSA